VCKGKEREKLLGPSATTKRIRCIDSMAQRSQTHGEEVGRATQEGRVATECFALLHQLAGAGVLTAASLVAEAPTQPPYGHAKVANREIRVWQLARRDRKGSLNDGRIQNPSNPFGIVPLSNFVPRGLWICPSFNSHSLSHEVPNPFLTIRNFFHRSTPLLTALKRMLLSRTARQHDACMLLNRLMANGPAASCFPRLVEAEVCEHLFEVLREAAGVCAHTTHRTWPWGWFLSSTARGSRGEGNR
jgi:hypothetical protein